MKLISLTQGFFAQVDDEDFDYLNQFKWHVHKDFNTCYARRKIKNNLRIFMHTEIMNTKGVDHVDRNGLNNQKNNLRKASQGENQRNKAKTQQKFSSNYKGVCFDKQYCKWRAIITFNKKRINLGRFENEIDAAKAYDDKAKELHKEFAKVNFGQ